jgi:hypothetical protein
MHLHLAAVAYVDAACRLKKPTFERLDGGGKADACGVAGDQSVHG